jgi:hypothetical protein
MTTTQNLENLTKAMNRRELEISRMTQYILKVGEEGAGAEYMNEYHRELEMWDEMKAKRDELKYELFKAAA